MRVVNQTQSIMVDCRNVIGNYGIDIAHDEDGSGDAGHFFQ